MAVWSDAMEEQFVIMVQERPALYDSTNKNYNNRIVKAQLWGDIELKLHTTEKEMKRRWESLRTQYVRYQKLPPTGRTVRQQWILSKLHFLEPHTTHKTKDMSNYSDKDSFGEDFDCQSEPHSDAPWTSPLLDECPQSPTPETAPLDSPGLPMLESTHQHTAEPPPPPPAPREGTGGRAKRFRREEPISETAANLISVINRTLEQLSQEREERAERWREEKREREEREERGEREERTEKSENQDGISIYLKYFEHRLRGLPPHLLPRVQRDIENLLFSYSVEEIKMDL
ncbi:hypothetical protein NL108_013500 [Boleophthalmus pectinirostris]|uniref:uncharacterized protein LOC110156652 n=1 Tax=Boleophthalmus pectinirostris TaxID=150288 RepID=UPI00242E05EC|nr:uncharacterized protein LOC110156652 [Boleophthalmus pectinirostris]KAJ0066473.1 hypothetical protein NL108_013500 [Boleophthalmus pectinirostris]